MNSYMLVLEKGIWVSISMGGTEDRLAYQPQKGAPGKLQLVFLASNTINQTARSSPWPLAELWQQIVHSMPWLV